MVRRRRANRRRTRRRSAGCGAGATSSRLTAGLANTRVIAVMDRESDAIDLFCAWRDEGGAGLLIRATHDRGLAEETALFETMRAAPGAVRPALADGRPADPETPAVGTRS